MIWCMWTYVVYCFYGTVYDSILFICIKVYVVVCCVLFVWDGVWSYIVYDVVCDVLSVWDGICGRIYAFVWDGVCGRMFVNC